MAVKSQWNIADSSTPTTGENCTNVRIILQVRCGRNALEHERCGRGMVMHVAHGFDGGVDGVQREPARVRGAPPVDHGPVLGRGRALFLFQQEPVQHHLRILTLGADKPDGLARVVADQKLLQLLGHQILVAIDRRGRCLLFCVLLHRETSYGTDGWRGVKTGRGRLQRRGFADRGSVGGREGRGQDEFRPNRRDAIIGPGEIL